MKKCKHCKRFGVVEASNYMNGEHMTNNVCLLCGMCEGRIVSSLDDDVLDDYRKLFDEVWDKIKPKEVEE